MWALRHFAVAVLGLALLAGGVLPPEHLHRSTPTRPQVLHHHFETVRLAAPVAVAISGDDDDHATAVEFDRVLAGGPTVASAHQPALLTVPGTLPGLSRLPAVIGSCEPRETPSPPPRRRAARAPPA
jgi:hypothetical protein